MTEPVSSIPKAVIQKKRHWSMSIVWVIPLIAALIGGWLAVSAIMNQGPTITIVFDNAEGLEAKRTKIKYKDVEIGTVQAIQLTEDHQKVRLTAQLDKDAEVLLREDTKFWVVKARISSGGVSGLTTLFSGVYIGVEVGESDKKRSDFIGLETPPVMTRGLPGKTFTLKARDLGSVDYGSPVYFRRIGVGEVVAYHLDEDGKNVSVDIFVHAPYDQFVFSDSRFWTASGIDVSLGAEGVDLTTESLAAIMLGGIAFATPENSSDLSQADEGDVFLLYKDQKEAFKNRTISGTSFDMVFHESVHGLSVGAPVELRGIPVGEVVSIGLTHDAKGGRINIPVRMVLYPDWLETRKTEQENTSLGDAEHKKILQQLVESGLRAQLRTGSLITGKLYVMLDFFPNSERKTVDISKAPLEIPTVSGDIQSMQASIASILDKLDSLPYSDLVNDLRTTMQTLDSTIKSAQSLIVRLDHDITPQISAAMQDAQKTLEKSSKLLSQDSPLQYELRDALREMSRAAQSMRDLTEYLSQHPETLIRGRPREDNAP